MKKNYKTKQKKLTQRYEQIQKEIQQLQQAINEKSGELLKLQGEYRLLDELMKEEK